MLTCRKLLISITFILASLVTFPTLVSAQEFVFTAIPDQDETRLRARFDQVADYLTKQLGVDVKYVPVKSYSAPILDYDQLLVDPKEC